MKILSNNLGKGLTLRKGFMALFAVLALALLIAAACGEAATATPEAMPDEPTAMADEPTAMADEPTAMADEPTAMADEPTAMPVPTAMTEAGARLRSEWDRRQPGHPGRD